MRMRRGAAILVLVLTLLTGCNGEEADIGDWSRLSDDECIAGEQVDNVGMPCQDH